MSHTFLPPAASTTAVTISSTFSCVCVFQVSLRKQEIADRLNAWIIFNQKNKELCEWLTQMENTVMDDSQLNIEEMVEKLKKVRGWRPGQLWLWSGP